MQLTRYLAITCAMLSFTSAAYAVDGAPIAPSLPVTPVPGGFSAELNGTQAFQYDSNPLRKPTGADGIYGSVTSPELVLRLKTPMSLVESNTRVDANIFDHSEFNSVDLHQKLLLKRENERWSVGLNGFLDYDTTRTSELTNYGLNLPRVHSTRIGVAPQVRFNANERDAAVLYSSVSHAEYDNSAYTDYNFYQVSPGIEHKFDPSNTGNFMLNAHRYETSSGLDSTSNSYGPSIGWTSILTPRLTLKTSAGAEYTDKSGANSNTDDSPWNYVFSADLAYKGTQNQADISATRARQPFGNGTETLLDTFAITGKHALNETLSLNADAKYQLADYEQQQAGINLDEGYQLGGGIEYDVMENVALTADYKYRHEALTNVTSDVDQHIVMVGVTFRPSWSRK